MAKNISLAVFGVFVGFIICFGILELYVRAFHLRPSWYKLLSSEYPYSRVHLENKEIKSIGPEFDVNVKFNSAGMRDREYSKLKARDVYRIIILGDSFTEAIQIPLEDTFQERLENLLNNNLSGKYEVMNAGASGWGSVRELMYYDRELMQYDEDLVIVALTINDIFDNARFMGNFYKLYGEELDVAAGKSSSEDVMSQDRFFDFQGVKSILVKYSRAYWFIRQVLPGISPNLTRILHKAGVITIEDWRKSYSCVYNVKALHYWESAWSVTEEAFAELNRQVSENDAKLVVFVVNMREQLQPEIWPDIVSRTDPMETGMSEMKVDFEKPNKRLSFILDRLGIPYFDPLPIYRKELMGTKGQTFHFPMDLHWNAEAHHLAGRLLFQWLVDNEIMPID